MVSAILDTVGALVTVLDPRGTHRAIQSRLRTHDRICARGSPAANTFGTSFSKSDEIERARSILSQLSGDLLPQDFQSHWVTRHQRRTASSPGPAPCCRPATERPAYIIATGIDITEREQLGEGAAGHQRARTAAHRAGSARRARPAPHRHRFHGQSARSQAGRKAMCPTPPMPPRS